MVKTVRKKFSGEVGIKSQRSCLVALVFCESSVVPIQENIQRFAKRLHQECDIPDEAVW